MKHISVFLCLFCLSVVNAQDKLQQTIDSLSKIEDKTQKTEAYHLLLEQQDTLTKTAELGTLYHKLGNCYYKTRHYDKALPFFKTAASIRHKLNSKENYNESRYLLSRAYYWLKDYGQEQKMLEAIIYNFGDDRFTCYAHRSLGRNERNKGDFARALHYLNMGLANTALCKNKKFESEIRYEIIATYAKKHESIDGLDENNPDFKIVKRNQNLIIVDSLGTKNQSSLSNNLAVIYESYGKLDEALSLYQKAHPYFVKSKDWKNEALEILINIGIIYSKQGKHKQANTYYDKVIKNTIYEEELASAYDNKGYYLPHASAIEKLPYFKKAIQALLGKDYSDTNFILPNITEIKTSEYEQDILTYLIDLANHYVKAYHETNEKIYLLKAKDACILLDKLISLLRHQSNTSQSKLFWIEKGVDLYMLAVNVSYLLNDAESGFYFMEKNKALLLQEDIKTTKAKLASNIPKDILEKEQQLYYQFLQVQEQFNKSTSNTLKQRYTEQSKLYKSFMDSIKIEYPQYVKTKNDVKITKLKKAITDCNTNNKHFIEYILNNKEGYGIYYNLNKPQFFKLTDAPKLQDDLKTLQQFFKKRDISNTELKVFQSLNYSVFKRLFPFKDAAKELKGKPLTIIADDALQYLPFEALIINDNANPFQNYMIQSTELSYLQSFSLTHQLDTKVNTPNKKLLVIAPSEFLDADLPQLSQTNLSIEVLNHYDDALILSKTKATKANFIKHQADYEIIHFNTHAGINTLSQKPWIAFNDTKMTLYELYGFENQADLVILDACKTSDGKQYSGEGVMNLSRGFFYNGSKSVLASLWKVNETSGNQIIHSFYTQLQQRHSKSKALQQAKVIYLQQSESHQKLPYYWAAFTLTGSTNAIALPVKTNSFIYTLVISMAILLLIVLLYKRRVSSHT